MKIEIRNLKENLAFEIRREINKPKLKGNLYFETKKAKYNSKLKGKLQIEVKGNLNIGT